MEENIIKLRNDGCTYNEIVKKLGCSKSTVSYHCRKNGISRFDNSIEIPCSVINNIQNDYDNGFSLRKLSNIYNYSRTVITKQIKNKRITTRQSKDERKKSVVKNVIYWRQKAKINLVEYKGGKCEVESCGYNKCIKSLQFHHINDKEKDFTISGKTKALEIMKKEVDKCILVCSNCHGEIHEELYKNGNSSIVNKIINK